MFKITITPPSYNKFSKEFDINQVIVGAGLSENFDLLIPESPIEKPLLKITLQNNKYYYKMRKLIYDMHYADKISVEIAERLLDKLEQSRNKRR